MAQIVAFNVPDIDSGYEALDALDATEEIEDAVLVYKNDRGHVKLRQTHDVTAGKGMIRGGLLGGLVSIVAGPFVGMAAVGATAGGVAAGLGDRGVNNRLMKLAGRQLENDQAAIFILAEDDVADAVVDRLRSLPVLASYSDSLEIGEFPVEAQKLVKDQIKLEDELDKQAEKAARKVEKADQQLAQAEKEYEHTQA